MVLRLFVTHPIQVLLPFIISQLILNCLKFIKIIH